MIYTRTLTAAEELLLKGEGFSAKYCLDNEIDYRIRVEREKREPEAVKAMVDGVIPPPAVISQDAILVEFLKSPAFKTVNEIVAERDIESADNEALALQAEIDAEQDPAKKAEKQAGKAAAISRKAEKEVELVAARAEKAALVDAL